jgi:hypothetical protein
MSIPSPPPALLRLTRKTVSLLGNGSGNKYILWQLPQCNITSNPYSGYTGTYGLLNCIAIQNGAISAVVWFYIPTNGSGTLLGYMNGLFPNAYGGANDWFYVGTDGKLYATDYAGYYFYVATPTPISPGWHMAVIEEWAASTSGPYYIALYLDGSFVGQTSTNNLPVLFGLGGSYPNNYIGCNYTWGSPGAPTNTWFFLNGAIAYIALYNRLLSASEVSAIYQGNRVTNGLVAEFKADNYDPSSRVWIDDVNDYVAQPASPTTTPSVVDFITTEFTSGINYDLLAQKIAEKITENQINIANLPINQFGNLNIGTPDQWGYPLIDVVAIAKSQFKSAIYILSNASITSNGSSSNYNTVPYRNFLVTVYVGSVSGTSPSLTVYFNAYDGNSGQSIPIASVTLTSAGATYILVQDFPGNQFNISWTVGGTSPSFGSVYISVYESW